MKTKEIKKDETTTWFEHRAMLTQKVDEFYNEDVVVEEGEVLEITRKPEKKNRYEYGFDGNRAYALYPAEWVKVFKVTEHVFKEIITEKTTKKIGAQKDPKKVGGVKRIDNTRTTTERVWREEEAVA